MQMASDRFRMPFVSAYQRGIVGGALRRRNGGFGGLLLISRPSSQSFYNCAPEKMRL
jgi:hypothetical protein